VLPHCRSFFSQEPPGEHLKPPADHWRALLLFLSSFFTSYCLFLNSAKYLDIFLSPLIIYFRLCHFPGYSKNFLSLFYFLFILLFGGSYLLSAMVLQVNWSFITASAVAPA